MTSDRTVTALDMLVVGLVLHHLATAAVAVRWAAGVLVVGASWSTWLLLATGLVAARRLWRKWRRGRPVPSRPMETRR